MQKQLNKIKVILTTSIVWVIICCYNFSICGHASESKICPLYRLLDLPTTIAQEEGTFINAVTPNKTLIIFDIDYTTLSYTSTIGAKYQTMVRAYQYLGRHLSHLRTRFDLWKKHGGGYSAFKFTRQDVIYGICSYEKPFASEPEISLMLTHLQQHDYTTYALTNTNPQLHCPYHGSYTDYQIPHSASQHICLHAPYGHASIRFDQKRYQTLQQEGIDFRAPMDRQQAFQDYTDDLHIIYTWDEDGGKGSRLLEKMDGLQDYDRVIMIDDQMNDIRSVSAACASARCDFLGFHYETAMQAMIARLPQYDQAKIDRQMKLFVTKRRWLPYEATS